MYLSEFHTHCESGKCLRGLAPSKGCAKDTKRNQCYEKFDAQRRKVYLKACQRDPRWERVRTIVIERDRNQCRVWQILTAQERKYVLDTYRADYVMLQDLDCAHAHGRNAAPEHKYDPDMIFLICRYFHGLLDTYHDPVTRKKLSRLEHEQWWDRIRSGRTVTSPYGGIPAKEHSA